MTLLQYKWTNGPVSVLGEIEWPYCPLNCSGLTQKQLVHTVTVCCYATEREQGCVVFELLLMLVPVQRVFGSSMSSCRGSIPTQPELTLCYCECCRTSSI